MASFSLKTGTTFMLSRSSAVNDRFLRNSGSAKSLLVTSIYRTGRSFSQQMHAWPVPVRGVQQACLIYCRPRSTEWGSLRPANMASLEQHAAQMLSEACHSLGLHVAWDKGRAVLTCAAWQSIKPNRESYRAMSPLCPAAAAARPAAGAAPPLSLLGRVSSHWWRRNQGCSLHSSAVCKCSQTPAAAGLCN